jgi:hypothetical protein
MRMLAVVIVLGLSLSSATALADDKSHRKATEELMTLMKMKSMMKNAVAQMLEVQMQANPAIAPYREVMVRFFDKYIGWDAIKDDYIKLYMKEFTEAEVKDMVRFYKSKTGKKAATKVPELMASGAAIGQQRVQKHMGELMKMLQDAQAKTAK